MTYLYSNLSSLPKELLDVGQDVAEWQQIMLAKDAACYSLRQGLPRGADCKTKNFKDSIQKPGIEGKRE